MSSDRERSGADTLRRIVRNMDYARESFNDRFTAEQLVALGKAHLASEYDYFPDQWTEQQVQDALDGHAPKWDDNGQPVIRTFTEAE